LERIIITKIILTGSIFLFSNSHSQTGYDLLFDLYDDYILIPTEVVTLSSEKTKYIDGEIKGIIEMNHITQNIVDNGKVMVFKSLSPNTWTEMPLTINSTEFLEKKSGYPNQIMFDRIEKYIDKNWAPDETINMDLWNKVINEVDILVNGRYHITLGKVEIIWDTPSNLKKEDWFLIEDIWGVDYRISIIPPPKI